MSYLACCIAVALFSIIAHKPIKRFPWVFYGIAGIICAVGIYFYFFPVQNIIARTVLPLDHKGILATAFFTVVIYIGVLPENSTLRRKLMPIRAQLSIVGSILILSHVLTYTVLYVGQIIEQLTLKPNVMLALIISIALVALLVALTITSFNAVKRKMRPETWKRLQKTTYLFIALIYVHIFLFLFPSIIRLSPHAILTFGAYTAVFGIYTVLRVLRYRRSVAPKDIENRK